MSEALLPTKGVNFSIIEKHMEISAEKICKELKGNISPIVKTGFSNISQILDKEIRELTTCHNATRHKPIQQRSIETEMLDSTNIRDNEEKIIALFATKTFTTALLNKGVFINTRYKASFALIHMQLDACFLAWNTSESKEKINSPNTSIEFLSKSLEELKANIETFDTYKKFISVALDSISSSGRTALIIESIEKILEETSTKDVVEEDDNIKKETKEVKDLLLKIKDCFETKKKDLQIALNKIEIAIEMFQNIKSNVFIILEERKLKSS